MRPFVFFKLVVFMLQTKLVAHGCSAVYKMQAVHSGSDAFLFKPDMLHEFSDNLLPG